VRTLRSVGYVKREEEQMILSQQTTTSQAYQTLLYSLPIDPATQEEKTHHPKNINQNNRGSRLKTMNKWMISTPNPVHGAKSRNSQFLSMENKCNL
jgi:hypothetical protein